MHYEDSQRDMNKTQLLNRAADNIRILLPQQ